VGRVRFSRDDPTREHLPARRVVTRLLLGRHRVLGVLFDRVLSRLRSRHNVARRYVFHPRMGQSALSSALHRGRPGRNHKKCGRHDRMRIGRCRRAVQAGRTCTPPKRMVSRRMSVESVLLATLPRESASYHATSAYLTSVLTTASPCERKTLHHAIILLVHIDMLSSSCDLNTDFDRHIS